jgi:3-keto-5-aminohexanoate cleavage enzyme
MSELKNYMLDDYRNPVDYCNLVWRGGLSGFPPAMVTCAITGGNNGKESNPNLPETIDEQVESTYEAYKAGAVMVHIHAREPENLAQMTADPKYYVEINRRIREKCPDIIINNTNIMGRGVEPENFKLCEPMDTITEARAEIGSIDISNYVSQIPMAPREPGEKPWVLNRGYMMTFSDAQAGVEKMKKYGVKPEFECFAMSDLHYVNWLERNGVISPADGPYWIQFVYTLGSNWNTPEFMSLLKQVCPKNAILGIIAAGAQQWPILAQALIHGLHVRVGMEDNVYYAKGEKAASNAQLVEKIIRIAKELGRPVATCEQARQMLGLGAPRTW